MILVIGNKQYPATKGEAKKILEQMKEYVPFGIYAVEKGNYIELRNDKCTSMTQLKELTRQYRQQGFKVYSNRG